MQWKGKWDYLVLYLATILLVMLLLPILILVKVKDPAAWFQGIGTVVAMFGAIGTASIQRRHAEFEDRKKDGVRKSDSINTLLALIDYQRRTFDAFEKACRQPGPFTYQGQIFSGMKIDVGAVIKLRHCAEMFLAFPIDTLDYNVIHYVIGLRENAGVAMSWIESVKHESPAALVSEVQGRLKMIEKWEGEVQELI